jgi:hypothetical protein
MAANNAKVQSVIENTFRSAVRILTGNGSDHLISDLYVQVDPENGEMEIYNEDERPLDKVVIFDWVNNNRISEETFKRRVCSTLKAVLTSLASKGVFDHSSFLKPFSVSLVDEDFSILEELLFLDENIFRLDDPLLKDLDEDLNRFLKELLPELSKRRR